MAIGAAGFQRWPHAVQRADAWGHYLHLPSLLIHRDVGHYDRSIQHWRQYYPFEADPREDKYGIRPTPTGQLAIKYPVGAALLQSPFFALAHLGCTVTGAYAADGFSKPYHWMIGLSSWVYALVGLFLLYRSLRVYTDAPTAGWTLAAIGLGTNLFYFVTVQPGMAHVYLFFWWALLIHVTIRAERGTGAGWGIGWALGGIAITRIPELIAVLIPLFWNGFGKKATLRQYAQAAAAFGVMLAPQLWYMKTVSGQWWYNGYGAESFDWAHSKWWSGWTDFQNGWLVYTPLGVLMLLGIFWLKKRIPAAFWPTVLLTPLHAYIIYAWWCWMYINGFGSRPMVELYPLLAFPLAALLAAAASNGIVQKICYAALVCLMAHNLFQTWQAEKMILWSERANRAYFISTLGKTASDADALAALESGELQPDTTRLVFVKKIGENTIPDSIDEFCRRRFSHSPPWSYRAVNEFALTQNFEAGALEVRPGDYLRASVWSYVEAREKQRNIDKTAKLVLDLHDGKGHSFKIPGITISSRNGNPDAIPWHTGATDQWGAAAFFVKIPDNFPADGQVKVYIWNPGGQKIWVDDLRVEHFR